MQAEDAISSRSSHVAAAMAALEGNPSGHTRQSSFDYAEMFGISIKLDAAPADEDVESENGRQLQSLISELDNLISGTRRMTKRISKITRSTSPPRPTSRVPVLTAVHHEEFLDVGPPLESRRRKLRLKSSFGLGQDPLPASNIFPSTTPIEVQTSEIRVAEPRTKTTLNAPWAPQISRISLGCDLDFFYSHCR